MRGRFDKIISEDEGSMHKENARKAEEDLYLFILASSGGLRKLP